VIERSVRPYITLIRPLFYSRLKTFLFCKSFPPHPFLFLLQDSLPGFPRLFTVISEHTGICFLLYADVLLMSRDSRATPGVPQETRRDDRSSRQRCQVRGRRRRRAATNCQMVCVCVSSPSVCRPVLFCCVTPDLNTCLATYFSVFLFPPIQ